MRQHLRVLFSTEHSLLKVVSLTVYHHLLKFCSSFTKEERLGTYDEIFVDKRLSYIFLFFSDPEIRTWFLIRHNYLPFILCGSYALFSTIIGPAIMKNRKPFELRIPMIIFNFSVVATYVTALTIVSIYESVRFILLTKFSTSVGFFLNKCFY